MSGERRSPGPLDPAGPGHEGASWPAPLAAPLAILALGFGLSALALWRAWLAWPAALAFAAAFLAAALLAARAGRGIRAAAAAEIARRRESEQEAQAANRTKSAFLANMSHELRTPLNAILGTADLLLGFSVPERQRGHLQVIASSAESLLHLIEDILDFAKLEAGRLRFDASLYRLREVMEEVRAVLAARAAGKDLALSLAIDPELPDLLYGDSGRLRQVLLNLGGNAVKYTPAGSVRIRAERFRLPAESEDRMRIAVHDTGIGISPRDQRHIFETFYQAESSSARKVGGSGLGLSICREIVEGMGGEIGFESERGAGSTFWFELPLVEAPGEEATTPSRPPVPESEPVPGFDRSRFRVLVVDDQATNRDLARAQLKALGYRAEVAPGGREALAALAEQRFDAVLMDCQMPELDGYDTTRRLRRAETAREDAPARRVPVIALTASATREEREKSLAVGMDDLLTKPYRSARLDAVLRRWLSADGKEPAGDREPAPATPVEAGASSLFETRIEALRSMGEKTRRDVLGETLGTYLRESRALVAALAEAQAYGDLGAMAQAAHALAGSSAVLGNEELSELARRLQGLARGEDSGALETALSEVLAEHERFAARLRELRDSERSAGPRP